MKYTSNTPSFPKVDWYYQGDAPTTISSGSPVTKFPALYRLTGNFQAAELTRDYFAELTAFALITAISAWPIFLSIVAVARMMRGY